MTSVTGGTRSRRQRRQRVDLVRVVSGLTLLIMLVAPQRAAAQGLLDQFSYEGLRLSGVGVELGIITSDRLTSTATPALRVDYGMVAPHVRVLLGVSYSRADFDAEEIAAFESRLRGVVSDPTGDFTIDVGRVTLTDVELDLSLQYLFDGGPRFTTYLGAGVAIHVRNGTGDAIEETFVEDALDTMAAGFVASLGAQFALTPSLHVTADFRGGLSSELRTASARGGVMVRLPGPEGRPLR